MKDTFAERSGKGASSSGVKWRQAQEENAFFVCFFLMGRTGKLVPWWERDEILSCTSFTNMFLIRLFKHNSFKCIASGAK